MNTRIIGILMGITMCAMPFVGFAEDDTYPDFIEEEYEDYEVFDDVEELIDEGIPDVVSVDLNTEDVGYDVEPKDADPVPVDVPAPRAVADRMSCDEIATRVAELRADVKSYPDLRTDLEYMLSRQRNQCAPRATRRPVHNYKNVNPVVDVAVPEPESVAIEPAIPEKTPEEIAAEEAAAEAERLAQIEDNLSNGLCGDGTKPNKYGCCAGEVFKQVERLNFACCPKDGDGDCHEPFKKS